MASGHATKPHKQAEHMAAPTSNALLIKNLDNTEPSTHGTKRTRQSCRRMNPQTIFDGHFCPQSCRWAVFKISQMAALNPF